MNRHAKLRSSHWLGQLTLHDGHVFRVGTSELTGSLYCTLAKDAKEMAQNILALERLRKILIPGFHLNRSIGRIKKSKSRLP
ncbi:MAG: hypothetical protein HY537_05770 [Deltaproteobacteria bacterium]|nr:hypothetical protein [Deltaproteobacteria bacterium]